MGVYDVLSIPDSVVPSLLYVVVVWGRGLQAAYNVVNGDCIGFNELCSSVYWMHQQLLFALPDVCIWSEIAYAKPTSTYLQHRCPQHPSP